jgi:hypothetical protein
MAMFTQRFTSPSRRWIRQTSNSYKCCIYCISLPNVVGIIIHQCTRKRNNVSTSISHPWEDAYSPSKPNRLIIFTFAVGGSLHRHTNVVLSSTQSCPVHCPVHSPVQYDFVLAHQLRVTLATSSDNFLMMGSGDKLERPQRRALSVVHVSTSRTPKTTPQPKLAKQAYSHQHLRHMLA